MAVLAAVIAAVIAPVIAPAPPVHATPLPGAEACPVFPADNVWHADVSALPVHPRSDAWITSMGGPQRRLHPDFGPSGEALPYGIPYKVVDGAHEKVTFTFDYADESDPGPYPFGPDVPVESGSDRHALMVDKDACRLYELFAVDTAGGRHHAGSGAIFDLRSNALRPAGWTSADAAGLPIFAGLLRRDEVTAGNVDHAIRVTASRTSRAYLWPARHFASSNTDPNDPPMGAWFRMKASYDISRFSPTAQVILRAFKKHGVIVADNGSNWYFTGSADDGWEPGVLDELKSIAAGEFEAIDASSLMVSPDSGQVRTAAPAPTTTRATTTTITPPPPTTTAVPATTTTLEVEVTAEPPTTLTTTARQEGRVPTSRRASTWWVGGAVGLALLVAIAISVRGRRRRRRP